MARPSDSPRADEHRLERHAFLPAAFACVLAGTLILIPAAPVSADTIDLSTADTHNPVPSIDLFADESAGMSLEEIRALPMDRFSRPSTETLNFSRHGPAYWVRFRVTARDAAVWLLKCDNPQIDHIDLYLITQEGVLRKTAGDEYPFEKREFQHRNFVFPLALPAGEAELYVRFKSQGSLFFQVLLMSPAAFARTDYLEQWGLGLYYGVIIVMVLFNFLIYTAVRDPAYLFYVFYILTFGLFQFALNGFGFEFLWPDLPFIENRVIPLLGITTVGFATMFSRVFLHTEVHAPRLDTMLVGLAWTSVPALLIAAFTEYYISIRIGSIFSVAFTILASTAAFLAWRQGFRPARFFLLGWSFFFIGIVVFGLFITGFLPGNVWTRFALQAGAAIELVILSFGLGDRLNSMRLEKEAAQAFALEEQLKQAELTANMNRLLEEEVRKKTADLNRAIGELRERDAHLQMELSLAHDIQKGLLPPPSLEMRNMRAVSYHRFHTKVGGDLTDILPMRGGRTGILIADVSGHGIPAALVTTMAKLSFAEQSIRNTSPSRIFRGVNAQLVPSISSLAHLTAFLVVVDRKLRITYSGAAHQDTLVYRRAAGTIDLWSGQGFIIGCMPDTGKFYFDSFDSLLPGDRVLLYTDGLADCRSAPSRGAEEFGLERITRLFRASCDMPIEEARRLLISEFEQFTEGAEADDDASFLLLEFLGDSDA